MCFIRPLRHEAKFGAHTELYAGISPEITLKKNGAYVIPWGRIRPDKNCPRRDIITAMASNEDGGLGYPTRFWEWCEGSGNPVLFSVGDELQAPKARITHGGVFGDK
ncbi:hypothetical protein N7454_002147 [Penicillium verhagenii]|nr:hypothetical protein N7454_002147 [Penicillium verhagenii]